MSPSKQIFSVVSALAFLLCSCQQSVPPRGGSVGVRNYSDAVVHINQVDPAYRAYFREQDAANYSLSDQRKAYIAATQTARTPVRASDYRPGDIRKRAIAQRRPLAARNKSRIAAATRSKASMNRAKAKVAVKKRAVAVRKPYRG